jgi:flagellar hook-associated protein 2
LASDAGIRAMKRELSAMTSQLLATSGSYRTLADLGVKTVRDGTLTLDSNRLDAILASEPEAVTNLINPATKTSDRPGLDGLLAAVSEALQGKDGALIASKAKLEKVKAALSARAEKLDKEMASYEARLNAAYSGMDTRLAKYRSIQSYMDQQIAMWNSSKSR